MLSSTRRNPFQIHKGFAATSSVSRPQAAPWDAFLAESVKVDPKDDFALYYLAFARMQSGNTASAKRPRAGVVTTPPPAAGVT